MSVEVCEILSDHLIASSELCGHLISVAAFGFQFVGHPEYIRHERYERNQFMYNVCFVFDAQTDVTAYRPLIRCRWAPVQARRYAAPVLPPASLAVTPGLVAGACRRKVAKYFRTIEDNHCFLSAPETRGRIEEIITGIFNDIKSTGAMRADRVQASVLLSLCVPRAPAQARVHRERHTNTYRTTAHAAE